MRRSKSITSWLAETVRVLSSEALTWLRSVTRSASSTSMPLDRVGETMNIRSPWAVWALLIVEALRSRISRTCWRVSGFMLRSWSVLSTASPCSGARPSSVRTCASSPLPTPLDFNARTKAVFTASTSSWEISVLLSHFRWTWALTLPIVFSLVSFTSPALYSPDAIFWNCRMEMLTLERLMVMVFSFIEHGSGLDAL